MKTFLLSLLVVSTSAFAQVAGQVGLSVPNGLEVGLNAVPSQSFRIGANYGYLHSADAVNLQVAGGKKLYVFGTVNMINVNQRGRNAIALALDEMIAERANQPQNTTFKRFITGYKTDSEDFRMTDYGLGAGLGYKFGLFFIEGGIRTTQITSISDNKVDAFVDDLKAYVDRNPNITFVERDVAMQQIELMRADTKRQIHEAFQGTPGELKFLPEVRIGIRIPIGR